LKLVPEQALSAGLLQLNRRQIGSDRMSVLPREPKYGHVGMGDHEAFPQTIDETIEIQ
jgi:hypothetical protein